MGLFDSKVEAKEPETTENELKEVFTSNEEISTTSLQRSTESNGTSSFWSSLFKSSPTTITATKSQKKTLDQVTKKVEENSKQLNVDQKHEVSEAKSSNYDAGWGYDLSPERKGEAYKAKWSRVLHKMEDAKPEEKIRCERNVYSCVKNSPLVKLMMGALKSSGCPVDIRRHISCEVCDGKMTGGYDPVLNQVVVCQNVANREALVQTVLTHEMIHMFDYCNNELDFRNIDHLACTEIRAANLANCSFIGAWSQGDASITNIRKTHESCVKTKALASILAVKNVSREEAIDAIERVFPKCYYDLEPIGRRLKPNSQDAYRAYNECPIYGYNV